MRFVDYRELKNVVECDFRFIFEDVLNKKIESSDSDQEVKFDQREFFKAVYRLFFGGESNGSLEDIKASAFVNQYHSLASELVSAQDESLSIGILHDRNIDTDKNVFIYSNHRILRFLRSDTNTIDLKIVDFIFTSQPKSSLPTVFYYNQKKMMDILSMNPHIKHDDSLTPFSVANDKFEYVQVIVPTCKTSKVFNPNESQVFIMKLTEEDKLDIKPRPEIYEDIEKLVSAFTVKGIFSKKIAEEDIFPNPYVGNRFIRQCQSGHYTCRFIEHCPIVNLRITKM